MPEKQAFICENCGAEKLIDPQGPAPDCCRQPMKDIPLDQCTLATTAEHSRFDQEDGPCDDGRAG